MLSHLTFNISFMIEFFESNPSPFTKFENFNNLVNLVSENS